MKQFTQDLIDKALNLGGTFYLPYRLHYTGQQLLKAYPNISQWQEIKKSLDPEETFYSNLYEYIKNITNKWPQVPPPES